MNNQRQINFILLFLVILDLFLTIWAFFYPELWFSFFHGSPYIDPQALLYRCGANWLAFFIIQAAAYLYWQKNPWLLVLVAGCRLGDSLTDITCLVFSAEHTLMAMIGFPLAGFGNLLAGLVLIWFFKKLPPVNQTSGTL
jgi:hypothetical protein